MKKFNNSKITIHSLFLLALCARVIYLVSTHFQTMLLHYNFHQGTDMIHWYQSGIQRYREGFIHINSDFSSLKHIYPDLLGLFIIIFQSKSIFVPIVFQIVLGAANVYLIYYCAHSIYRNYSIAYLAVILYIFSGIFWVYELLLLRESIAVFLFLSILAISYKIYLQSKSREPVSMKIIFLYGLTFSLAICFRFNFYILLIIALSLLVFWFRRHGKKQIVQLLMIFLLGLFLILGPFRWRSNRILIQNSQLGLINHFNLFNHIGKVKNDLNKRVGGDVYKYMNRGERDQRLHPAIKNKTSWNYFKGWLQNKTQDAYLWFSSYEIPENIDFYQFYQISGFIQAFPVRMSILFPLGLIGLILSFRRYPRIYLLIIWITVFSLSFIITLITSRYRLPIVAALTIPAAFYIHQCILFIKGKPFLQKPYFILSIGATIFLFYYFHFFPEESAHIKQCFYSQEYLGILIEHKRFDLAEQEANFALNDCNCEYAITALGKIYLKLQRPELAYQILYKNQDKVIDINYTAWLYYTGMSLINTGKISDGLKYLKQMKSRKDVDPTTIRQVEAFIQHFDTLAVR